jgi:type III restriction enzyme
MELKTYQSKVIKDLEEYLEYVREYGHAGNAFNKYWADRIGPYNPIEGTGMQPYKNTIPDAAHVCIKVPTAGGKTFIACNALKTIFDASGQNTPKVVVWLVPWSNLLDQTVKNLSNPDHPYRQKLNSLFNNRVAVYEKNELITGANFNPSVVSEQLSIIVMNFASLRVRSKSKEDKRVYRENSRLISFVNPADDRSHLLEDIDETALINVIRGMQPVLVVDESHNAESALSVEMLTALNPSFILDLTATPKDNSNIISLVPAIELKKEHMVKLPVIVYNHHDKTDVINSALHLQSRLETLAIEEEKNGGRYIRPIVLFQAQARTNEENTTFEKLKEQLLKAGIPEEQVKIKTANKDELKGIELSSRQCPVRYIITINALKEGWDCPFAYILASLADKSSVVDVEQILGRVLRQPYVVEHTSLLLNMSYVLTASAKFKETIGGIVKGLQDSGFSDIDYREKDVMSEEEKKKVNGQPLADFLFPEKKTEEPEEEIDIERISFGGQSEPKPPAVADIEQIAVEKNREMETLIQRENNQTEEENIFKELGDKVKRYKMIAANQPFVENIALPFLFHSVSKNMFEDEVRVPLSQESLLTGFRLNVEDIKIDFEKVDVQLYKVDIDKIKDEQYDSRYTKFDNNALSGPIIEHILAKPKEEQVKNIAFQLARSIGDISTVRDIEVRNYITRVLSNMDTDQLQDVLMRPHGYGKRIKEKIFELISTYAEGKFNEMFKLKKIIAEPIWRFPSQIVPGELGASISKSLYEREGDMNNFETSFITEIAALSNIRFWHRNLLRGKGFAINGFNNNHYPDFIVYSESGNIILIETKGGDRDNSDSAAKCRLGNKWAELAGKEFHYFMVFEKNKIEDAYSVEKAKELIRML